jgi:beta-lactamase regulating signal transducer with metallopeptidase domain
LILSTDIRCEISACVSTGARKEKTEMEALSNWLIAVSGRGSAALLVWSWQALSLLALVWITLKICRLKSPALRHQVWLFGLVAMAMLPLSSRVAQRFPSLQPVNRMLNIAPALNYISETPVFASAFVLDVAQPPEPIRPWALPGKAPSRSSATARVKEIPILALLFVVWGIGALITLAQLFKNQLRILRVSRRARAVIPSDLDCGELQHSFTSRVKMGLSPEVHSPIIHGVFRPTILLPADIAAWTTPEERAAMIRHELAHIERWDPIVNNFQAALTVTFFFHPLVRYACRQLIVEREMACDDRVVELGASADVYANCLLKAAERNVAAVEEPSGVRQLALFSAKQILERRLQMILNTDRARAIIHPWRYLIFPLALIAVAGFLLIPRYSAKNLSSYALAKDSTAAAGKPTVKRIYSPQEQELIDMIQQVAAAVPQEWQRLYLRSGLPDKRLLLDDFKLYNNRSQLTIIPPRPQQIPDALPTQVEVGDFEVSINGDSAVVDFIGKIHLSAPGYNNESVVTDPYRATLEKVGNRWQANRKNRMPWVGAMFWPPGPPAPPYELHGVWADAQKAVPGINIVNSGDAEFSIGGQTPTASDGAQTGDAELSELEHSLCRCIAQPVRAATIKLGELALRGDQGIRFLHSEKGVQMVDREGLKIFAIDSIFFKDRFELQWGEQTYYGLGSVKASYHQGIKRLGIGSFPETKLYRTPDRSGDPITLRQLAQELKDRALRKN